MYAYSKIHSVLEYQEDFSVQGKGLPVLTPFVLLYNKNLDHIIRKGVIRIINLQFGFWKKSRSDKKTSSEIESSQKDARKNEKILQERVEPEEVKTHEVHSLQDDKSLRAKLEENQSYAMISLTKAGGTLVLKAEKPIKLWDDVRKEIAAIIEENARLKQSLQDKNWTESDEYMLTVGNFHYFNGVPHRSLEFYDQILKRNPDKIAALNNKGVVLDNLGRHAEALECYDKASKTHTENANLSCNRGISLYKQGRYMEALKSFDMTLTIEPLYVSAISFKAHTLSRLGRKDKALEFYNRALASDPDSAELSYNKARICSLKGIDMEALASLEKAIMIDQRCKTMAAQEEDFASLKKNQKFLRLVQ